MFYFSTYWNVHLICARFSQRGVQATLWSAGRVPKEAVNPYPQEHNNYSMCLLRHPSNIRFILTRPDFHLFPVIKEETRNLKCLLLSRLITMNIFMYSILFWGIELFLELWNNTCLKISSNLYHLNFDIDKIFYFSLYINVSWSFPKNNAATRWVEEYLWL